MSNLQGKHRAGKHKGYIDENFFFGCYGLVGAVIRQAILDYQSRDSKNKYRRSHWKDAETFLFRPGRLERLLEQFGMEDAINLEYVRRLAKTSSVRSSQAYHYSMRDD
jgi:hypothetical protein